MAGLLDGVLPWVYSRGNALQRGVNGLLSDPLGSMEQTAGLLADYRREDDRLNKLVFADPKTVSKPERDNALNQLSNRMLSGPLSFAPTGMTKYMDFKSGKYAADITMDEMRSIAHIPTVEKMRISLDAAGDDAFQEMVQAQFKAYKPKTPDQEAMLVESILNQIVAKMRR
jgi:hypothetical protein